MARWIAEIDAVSSWPPQPKAYPPPPMAQAPKPTGVISGPPLPSRRRGSAMARSSSGRPGAEAARAPSSLATNPCDPPPRDPFADRGRLVRHIKEAPLPPGPVSADQRGRRGAGYPVESQAHAGCHRREPPPSRSALREAAPGAERDAADRPDAPRQLPGRAAQLGPAPGPVRVRLLRRRLPLADHGHRPRFDPAGDVLDVRGDRVGQHSDVGHRLVVTGDPEAEAPVVGEDRGSDADPVADGGERAGSG